MFKFSVGFRYTQSTLLKIQKKLHPQIRYDQKKWADQGELPGSAHGSNYEIVV